MEQIIEKIEEKNNNEKKDKKKRKIIIPIIIIVTILLIILFVAQIAQASSSTGQAELTQLQSSSTAQMMGYIIKTASGKVIVIDGGRKEDKANLLNHINKLGGEVEAWFITHPHNDHAGAFISMINEENISIKKVYYTINDFSWYKQYEAERLEDTQEFIQTIQNKKINSNVQEVELNQKISIDDVQCEILGIKNPEIITNPGNNSSMVIKVEIADSSILFLGDTGEESGDKLLQTQKEKLKSKIVQVAHHGQNGAKQTLYQEIQPEICLWPTPEWLWNNDIGIGRNSGPWKTFETQKWMEELKVKIHIVQKDGDITISL